MREQAQKTQIATIKAVRPWYRVHPYTFGASQYNSSATGDSRFSPFELDDHSISGALYCGEDSFAAFCETVFRNVLDETHHPQVLHTGEFRDKNLSLIQPRRDINLVDLRSVQKWPKASEAVTTIDYAFSRDFGGH